MSLVLAACAFVTVTLVILALARPRPLPAADRLAPYAYAELNGAGILALPFWQRVLLPLFRHLVALAGRLTPARIKEEAEVKLDRAGNPIEASLFLVLRLVTISLAVLWGVVPLLTNSDEITFGRLALGVFTVYLGLRAPLTWLNLKVSSRQHAIERGLPDAMDLVVVCIESGLSFDAALRKVTEKTEGPLQAELERTLQEMQLGKLRREALRDLAKRVDVTDLNNVITALTQADQMGLSMANVLRAQADDLRIRRRQRAEETARQAPVKMLFPLILFIFPAMMLVTLGPAVMAIYTNVIQRLAE